MVCQAALGVFLARPWVAEINIKQVNLVVGKKLVNIRRIKRDKKDIFESFADCSLHGKDKRVLHALDGDQQHIRLGLGCLDGEFALAAADLDAKFPGNSASGCAICRAAPPGRESKQTRRPPSAGPDCFFFSFAYAFPALSEMLVGWKPL